MIIFYNIPLEEGSSMWVISRRTAILRARANALKIPSIL